ncbi:MAG TPA: GntR family transcriptional regulator [Gammaproteobacteria bacterium]|jgi:GntR family transcriptional regulator|nr:GntR family transcriptional regulator [Xanthomonadales bacterium]MCB1604868.1 GntR family transcriptional regulator [Xanthomonadales bacterium]HOP21380.1 GntR family transcriptional regulator [Gammaproteobacteria bacterium]HPI94760.1 GntR family transcriptional regulator [Gammaproteobacteria bacterium]HPQ86353.1 GntR family transcriptional regulator [Gammaproteobacteria bacterium]
MSFQWNDKEPIYLQLRDQIRNMILIGDLKENEALPSVRQVAADYQLNPITVSKAWQHLVDEGLVEKKRGLGMFVIENAREQLMKSDQEHFLKVEWPQIELRIKNLGININTLISSLKEVAGENK